MLNEIILGDKYYHRAREEMALRGCLSALFQKIYVPWKAGEEANHLVVLNRPGIHAFHAILSFSTSIVMRGVSHQSRVWLQMICLFILYAFWDFLLICSVLQFEYDAFGMIFLLFILFGIYWSKWDDFKYLTWSFCVPTCSLDSSSEFTWVKPCD